MRVLCCGDRNWWKYSVVKDRLSELPAGTVIIQGCCRGADACAAVAGEFLGFNVLDFPADWEHDGKAAGPIRNKRMLLEGKPDLVIAFHHDLASSRGTKDMVRIARMAGIPVEVIE